MSDGTHIEWTDATWNVVNGCSVVSPGCTNCYAMKQAHRFPARQGLTQHTKGGMVWTGEVRFNDKVLLDPLRWRRPRKIFVCAHGDLFHEKVPDEWIDRVFAVMALAPHHTFQVLTKRPERMREFLTRKDVVRRIFSVAHGLRFSGIAPNPERRSRAFHAFMAQSARDVAWTVTGGCAADEFERREPGRDYPSWVRWPLPNVWLGTSVEDQKRADERIPVLLDTPAAIRWLSCEPLLGPVDLSEWFFCPTSLDQQPMMDPTTGVYECCAKCDYTGIAGFSDLPIVDWVVAGGESGPNARPMHPAWARSLRDQCAAAVVPFLFKQWGNFRPCTAAELKQACGATLVGDRVTGAYMLGIGKGKGGRLLDGVQHDGYPA
jgi:protein gp37